MFNAKNEYKEITVFKNTAYVRNSTSDTHLFKGFSYVYFKILFYLRRQV